MKHLQKIVLGLWLLVMLASLSGALLYPHLFTTEAIAHALEYFEYALVWVYLAVMIVRGFTLLPSTPFVLAGIVLLPHTPWLLLAISLLGICLSATLLYYFSDFLGFGNILEAKYPQQVSRLQHLLDQPFGVLLVFLWSFFPLVPTDVICYVAGALKMRFAAFLGAVFLGELLLCGSCIFVGQSVFY